MSYCSLMRVPYEKVIDWILSVMVRLLQFVMNID